MKVYLLYIGILFIIGCSCVCNKSLHFHSKEYIGHALLIPKHTPIPLYDSCRKEITGIIINDTLKESYALIAIEKIKDSIAKVIANYPLENNRKQCGWIDIKYLGIHLSFSTDTLYLMSNPNVSSKVSFTLIRPHWGDFYPIIDAQKGWLYIQNIHNLNESGWLSPQNQCNNPYTPCN